jgi:SAM-dependent methyltransferase
MSFDVAAESYDRFMGAWSSELAPQLADFAGVAAGRRVLDVGCGPGALTTELVRRVGPTNVAAVDPSEPFVAAARERHPGVDVRRATAEALPFPDATFDAALAQLVVHFLRDPLGGIREMARVTRTAGVVAACVWDFGGDRSPHGPFWRAARELEPDVEDESERAGAREGHLEDLFARADLGEIVGADLQVRRTFPGFEAWWEPYTRGVGPAGGFLASLGSARQAAMEARCRELLPDGPFELIAHAWAARGRVGAD